jgi:hypothetical protein
VKLAGFKAGCENMAHEVSSSMPEERVMLRAMSYLILAAVTILEMALNFARGFSDSGSYLQLATSGTTQMGLYVNLRFMLPFLAGSLYRALPFIGITTAFGLCNCFFWAGGVAVAYKVGTILSDRNGGFLLALAFTTSVPMLAYGAAILPDNTGYFFAGLALLLAMRTSPSRVRSAVEGVVLAVGPFFHFSAFLGLGFAVACRLRHRRGLWFLLGALSFSAGAMYFVYAMGLELWQRAIATGLGAIQAVGSGLLVYRGDRSLALGLAQTFFVFAPIQFLLDRLYNMLLVFLTSDLMTADYLWFAALVVLGFWKSPRKPLLAAYCVTMAVFPVVFASVFIERYLFTTWLFFLPVLVLGVRYLSRFPASIMAVLLSRPGVPKVGVLTSPDFYAIIFFAVQGISNTVAITYGFHLSPPPL